MIFRDKNNTDNLVLLFPIISADLKIIILNIELAKTV
tara:strand:- start:3 stop:113 length:111 start_codon:yes stop_codon:yes gene_type:complete